MNKGQKQICTTFRDGDFTICAVVRNTKVDRKSKTIASIIDRSSYYTHTVDEF